MRNDSFRLPEGVRPNIICHHGRYDRETLARVMPRDTVYVTILRHPVKQYDSTFNYMGFKKLLAIQDKGDPLEKFLENPEKFLVNYLLSEDLRVNSDRLKLIRNGMAFDLGLNSSNFDNSVEIESFLESLKREFDLVLLAEFFDESLVLLKDLLCLPLEDVTYFKLNVRKLQENTTHFSVKTINNMQRWNNVDFLIYRQFRDILKEKIAEKTRSKDGARFQTELKKLRAENVRMRQLCLRNVTKTLTLQYGVVVNKLELNKGLDPRTRAKCDDMRRNEVDYIKYLRDKQSSFVRTMFLNRARDAVIGLLRLVLGFLQ
jgi:galactosylceramide sulfotransferase